MPLGLLGKKLGSARVYNASGALIPVTVVLAGPIGDGSGAMVVLQVRSENEARRVVEGDPYTAAGVGVDHVLRPWNVVIPADLQ